jgi:hypothetical protein
MTPEGRLGILDLAPTTIALQTYETAAARRRDQALHVLPVKPFKNVTLAAVVETFEM